MWSKKLAESPSARAPAGRDNPIFDEAAPLATAMRKTLINPETGDWADHEVAYSDAVTVEYPSHTRVFISGVISDAAGIEAQTRDVLSQIESRMTDAGGQMDDIVRVRVYLSQPHMDAGTLETVHDVRCEFFGREHFPASTLVEVEGLVEETALIEIDADGVIPTEGWHTESPP